eukprot:TRINITY_DN21616_c0_g1_i1.p1 TRINITY_DN21616_c0_g1~~TRINITY_DN21616_c0_g1_i1.p1  ORF type:complete len:617 (+),score=194.10 TRINITY_DN21616_c0_g1_i1:116-1966(+)
MSGGVPYYAEGLGNPPVVDETSLDLAVIGNCACSAFIDKKAKIVWSCLPRLDGDPIFCSLLKGSNESSNDIGFFGISLANYQKSEQGYLRNSSIVCTKLYDSEGGCVEVKDFFPRFESSGREYRPNMIVRILTPIAGRPRAAIKLRPTFGYGWGTPEKTRGSNHVRYLLSNMTVRLTTNAPISYIVDEVLFEIDEPVYLILMPDESLKNSIQELATSYLDKTLNYWNKWTRNLAIPFEWQTEVIRSAIALKMSSFEETGAIVAAMTTSIPHSSKSTGSSNEDLRYCWVRDSYWIVQALNKIGAATISEGYIKYLSNVVSSFHSSKSVTKISSVYGLSLETRLHERDLHRLPGYHGMGPVRLGNRDSEIPHNDVYGAALLTLTRIFFDQRLFVQGSEALWHRLEALGEECAAIYNKPDFTTRQKTGDTASASVHTYSAAMCWAGCDRLAKIAAKLDNKERAQYWSEKCKAMKEEITKRAWNAELKSFTTSFDSKEVNYTLLGLPEIGFVSAKSEEFMSTLAYFEKTQVQNGHVTIKPNVALNSATFRYIKVLNEIGRTDDARRLFEGMLKLRNSSGLISETYDLETNQLWGNFPMNIAMVGLIDCAIALSKPWSEAF